MIEIYLLEQFDAFARYGTLLKASEELHIPHFPEFFRLNGH